MAQYQLEQRVAVGPAADGDSLGVTVGEVDLGLAARWMLLGEVDLLIRPVDTRQSCNRRCRVRSWDALNRPGNFSSSHSIIVVALSRGSISSSQTPSKGSGRVRHLHSCLVSDGSGPHCHFRADRSLIPATAAAVCCFFPSILFCLNSMTCWSLINPVPPYRMITICDRQK